MMVKRTLVSVPLAAVMLGVLFYAFNQFDNLSSGACAGPARPRPQRAAEFRHGPRLPERHRVSCSRGPAPSFWGLDRSVTRIRSAWASPGKTGHWDASRDPSCCKVRGSRRRRASHAGDQPGSRIRRARLLRAGLPVSCHPARTPTPWRFVPATGPFAVTPLSRCRACCCCWRWARSGCSDRSRRCRSRGR